MITLRRGAVIERAAPGEVRVRRALLSVSDKAGVARLRPRPRGARRGARLHRGHRARAHRRRDRGALDRGLHRLSGDHGRAREDPAPAAVRGPAGPPRRRRPSAGRRRAGNRASRSRVREPLPVRADRRTRGRLRAGDHREHRHRRPDDDQGGGQEQRLRGRRGRSRRLPGGARGAARPATVACRSRRAHGSRPRRSPAPPATTPRSRPGSRCAPTRASRRPGAMPTRRSPICATARTRISTPPSTRASGASTHLLEGVTQLHGKELSFNNLLDLSSARELVEDFDEPACAIVKHNNPCGCAVARERPDRLRARLRL